MIRLIFVHGFGGFNQDWAELVSELDPKKFEIHYLAIPGHAEQPSCKQMGVASPAALAKFWADKLQSRWGKDFYLVGYSMGARMAALTACQSGCKGLVLLSGGMGLTSEAEKSERRASDQRLAEQLELSSQNFWTHWYAQELFASFSTAQRGRLLRSAVEQKTQHNPLYLAEALRCLGLAEHEYLITSLKDALSSQKIDSLLYIAGERDKKYLQFAALVEKELPRARVLRAVEAGHVLTKEAPQFCAKALAQFVGEKDGTESNS